MCKALALTLTEELQRDGFALGHYDVVQMKQFFRHGEDVYELPLGRVTMNHWRGWQVARVAEVLAAGGKRIHGEEAKRPARGEEDTIPG